MTVFAHESEKFPTEPIGSNQGEVEMKKTIKLTVASLIVALATTVGMAAPADAKAPTTTQRIFDCC